MGRTATLLDVRDWAVTVRESAEAIRCLEKIPARLELLDADLGSLPADLVSFERQIAGRGYALVLRAQRVEAAGRRMDSRVRALLRRFWAQRDGNAAADDAVRARWTALIALIAAQEGRPGTGTRWNIGRHRTLTILRARSTLAPQDLTQTEIDRIGREASAEARKSLRKAVAFLDGLANLSAELPELAGFLPSAPLAPPAGSSRARRIDWQALPAAFRASFEAAADACLADGEDLAEELLARIEAGEDPDIVMTEADMRASRDLARVNKPTAAREGYRQAVAWLVRTWEDAGGDPASLRDMRELFTRTTIEQAITGQIARASAAHDLRDPILSTTLKTCLTNLTTLARRGLRDGKAVAVISLLRARHYDVPRKRLMRNTEGDGILMDVDRIFARFRQRPDLVGLYANAPARIAGLARAAIEQARADGNRMAEITGLRLFAGAAAFAIQLSRPLRTACLRHARITATATVPANLLRSAPGKPGFSLRFAPWEIKNAMTVTVDITGTDAAILTEWLEIWRPRMIALQGLDSVYLFPGQAVPKPDEGDPMLLPRGSYSVAAFVELWRDAAALIGVEETPHRMRHVVALLILAQRPGNYALVSAVLGNTEATARRHYGRDDGQAAASEVRAALLAEHPDFFRQLQNRHRHAR